MEFLTFNSSAPGDTLWKNDNQEHGEQNSDCQNQTAAASHFRPSDTWMSQPWSPSIEGALPASPLFLWPSVGDSDIRVQDELDEASILGYPGPVLAVDNPSQFPFPMCGNSSSVRDGVASEAHLDAFGTSTILPITYESLLNTEQSHDCYSTKMAYDEPESLEQDKARSTARRTQKDNERVEIANASSSKRIRSSSRSHNSSYQVQEAIPPLRNLRTTKSSVISKSVSITKPKTRISDSARYAVPRSPKGRKNHNLIEKKYRSKLNSQFETLLAALPPDLVADDEQSEKKISKAEVLAFAREHIEALEKEKQLLECSRTSLIDNADDLKGVWMSLGGEMMP